MGDELFVIPDGPPRPRGRTTREQVNGSLLHRPEDEAKDEVLREKFWHRAAAYMIAAGMSPKEVAAANDAHPQQIYKLLRTGWFQEIVTQKMEENGAKNIMSLFAGEQMNSFVTLVELRDNPKVSASVRASVATRILEQMVGKPTQRVEVAEGVRSDDPVAEAERLERENARLAQRLAQ